MNFTTKLQVYPRWLAVSLVALTHGQSTFLRFMIVIWPFKLECSCDALEPVGRSLKGDALTGAVGAVLTSAGKASRRVITESINQSESDRS